jgi:putative spermidine/putrescine transport system permease protein
MLPNGALQRSRGASAGKPAAMQGLLEKVPVAAVDEAGMRVHWGWVLLPPALLSFLTLIASQSVFVVGSFRRDLGMGRMGERLEWSNYLQLFADDYYLETLGISLRVSLVATVLTVLLAFPAAYVLARMRSRWSLVLLAGVVVSSFVSIVVKVLGLILIFGANGPLNKVLLALHLVAEPVPILGTFAGVVAGLMYYSLGFAILMFYSIIVTVPRSLEEAAGILGSSPWGVFTQVILPLCMPGLVGGALLVFNVSMGGFTSTALIGAGRVITLPVLIQRTMLVETNFGMAATLAVGLLLTVLAVNVVAVRLASRTYRGALV